MLIESTNYKIRKLVITDSISLFKNYKGNKHCAKYLNSTLHTDLKETQALINKCLSNYQINKPSTLIFAVVSPNTDEVIGLIVFVFKETYAEIHFGISHKFSGFGIATAICKDGITWLKNRGFTEIRTQPHQDHCASLRVLTKCGFKNHGLLYDFAIFPQLVSTTQNCVDMRLKFK